jgi:hypothetical protein
MNPPERRLFAAILVFLLGLSTACSTESLSSGGSTVVASRNAPAANCKSLALLVGHGGGTFGGGFIANDDLIEYAMNDLRNQAAEAGGNYVQYDPPQLGEGDGTTTTATVSGTAYLCP